MSLHIRKKKNSSGSISIQIIDRKNRGYKVIETIACVRNEKDLVIYLDIANKRLKELNKKLYPTLFDNNEEELTFLKLSNKDLIPVGDELIFGKIFKKIGCSKIDLEYKKLKLFKDLVISRLLYPGSKLYLIDYLEYFKKETINKNEIYRFLDNKECNITFNINNKKIIEDSKLDVIKGFITNDFTLSPNEIIEHYNNQYDVERAFRISKTNLKIRPIYHGLETRIKAHILISFVSYAIYKEFDSKLKENEISFTFSQKLLRDIIKHMFAMKVNNKLMYLKFEEIQQQVYDAINS